MWDWPEVQQVSISVLKFYSHRRWSKLDVADPLTAANQGIAHAKLEVDSNDSSWE
jgi:hypothetical protein